MDNENKNAKNVEQVSEGAKEPGREFKPMITRMDKFVAAGAVATAISIGVSVKGNW